MAKFPVTVPLTTLYGNSTDTSSIEAPRTSLTQIVSTSDKYTSSDYSKVEKALQENAVKGELNFY